MYGIIGEHDSDFRMLKSIIKKHCKNPNLKIKGGGLGNCKLLLSDGARELRMLHSLGMRRFIICHDSDNDDHKIIKEIESEIERRVIVPSEIPGPFCTVIPVQEIEAWVLADIGAVTRLFPSWRPEPKPISNPEAIRKPCEHLVLYHYGSDG